MKWHYWAVPKGCRLPLNCWGSNSVTRYQVGDDLDSTKGAHRASNHHQNFQ